MSVTKTKFYDAAALMLVVKTSIVGAVYAANFPNFLSASRRFSFSQGGCTAGSLAIISDLSSLLLIDTAQFERLFMDGSRNHQVG
jgi:hypothetical protein